MMIRPDRLLAASAAALLGLAALSVSLSSPAAAAGGECAPGKRILRAVGKQPVMFYAVNKADGGPDKTPVKADEIAGMGLVVAWCRDNGQPVVKLKGREMIVGLASIEIEQSCPAGGDGGQSMKTAIQSSNARNASSPGAGITGEPVNHGCGAQKH
jgi:hypothetical protein